MGNCISRISKDPFFHLWKDDENDPVFSNGLSRRVFVYQGNIYRSPFFDKLSKNNDFDSVANWGMVDRPLNRQEKNIFSMLLGILNKNDKLYQESTYYHIHTQKKLLSNALGV